jgi:hypothetical protein
VSRGDFDGFPVLWAVTFYFDRYVIGVSCLCLHALLNQIAALVLCSFSLMFLNLYINFACWALPNLMLC